MAPFERAVEAGAAGVMCSYNAVDGHPMCASPLLQVLLLSH
jgi:beta-glucosidase-like glycosyl hydrolase